jgi:hypothetical protein
MIESKENATTDKYGYRAYSCNICGRTYGKTWVNHQKMQHKGEVVRPLQPGEKPQDPDCELVTNQFQKGNEFSHKAHDIKSMAAPALSRLENGSYKTYICETVT